MLSPAEHELILSPSLKGQAVLEKVKDFIKKYVDPREKVCDCFEPTFC